MQSQKDGLRRAKFLKSIKFWLPDKILCFRIYNILSLLQTKAMKTNDLFYLPMSSFLENCYMYITDLQKYIYIYLYRHWYLNNYKAMQSTRNCGKDILSFLCVYVNRYKYRKLFKLWHWKENIKLLNLSGFRCQFCFWNLLFLVCLISLTYCAHSEGPFVKYSEFFFSFRTYYIPSELLWEGFVWPKAAYNLCFPRPIEWDN